MVVMYHHLEVSLVRAVCSYEVVALMHLSVHETHLFIGTFSVMDLLQDTYMARQWIFMDAAWILMEVP